MNLFTNIHPWKRLRTEPSRAATPHPSPFTTHHSGFSLIEINIVLLVIGVGLVALLGLFPVGLRQAGLATADTAQATFADQMLSILHGQAATITNWTDWREKFKELVLKDARIGNAVIAADAEVKITDYLSVRGNTVRYLLSFESVGEPLNFGGRLMRASVRVIDRDLGDLANSPLYSTDFVFMGTPPQ